jgi:site-specific DNA-adenine methylase
MTVPQPFQYQGSKRALAPLILQYLPISTTRLVEPFCGSAALSIATVSVWFQILIVKTGLNYQRRPLSFQSCARS